MAPRSAVSLCRVLPHKTFPLAQVFGVATQSRLTTQLCALEPHLIRCWSCIQCTSGPSIFTSQPIDTACSNLRTLWRGGPVLKRLPAFSPWQVGRLIDAGKPQRQDIRVLPGFRLFARTIAGSVRSCLHQPTTQRASETQMLDDYLIDTSDRTTLHSVRSDLCRSRHPEAKQSESESFSIRPQKCPFEGVPDPLVAPKKSLIARSMSSNFVPCAFRREIKKLLASQSFHSPVCAAVH